MLLFLTHSTFMIYENSSLLCRPCLAWLVIYVLFSRSLTSFFRRWLPWLRRELRIPALWGSPHGSTNERAWREKLRARVRTSSPSSWRVWRPRWVSSCHVVRTGARQDERRPCLQHLLSLWQCRAGQYLTVSVWAVKGTERLAKFLLVQKFIWKTGYRLL